MDENIAYKNPDEKEITQAKVLLLEYVKWLNQDLYFQYIHEELEHFPEKYSEPDGSFIVATENDTVVGCVELKKPDDGICEMKRLFVTDKYKGKGIGKKLVEKIIEEAQIKNYGTMRLDTLDTITVALEIYRRHGFYEIDPYYKMGYRTSQRIYRERFYARRRAAEKWRQTLFPRTFASYSRYSFFRKKPLATGHQYLCNKR